MSSETSRVGRQLVNFRTNEIESIQNANLKSSIWRNYCGGDFERALAEWGGLSGDSKLIGECQNVMRELTHEVGRDALEYYYLDNRGYLAIVFPDTDRVVMGYININCLDSRRRLNSSVGAFREYWRTPFSNYSSKQIGKLRSSLPEEKNSPGSGIAKYMCVHSPGISRAVTADCEHEMTFQDHLDLGFLQGDITY